MTVAVLTPPRARAAIPTRLDAASFAVATDHLGKRFGRETALADLDLQVPQGAVYVLAGANGAGKSTLLRILLNRVRADHGRAQVFGLDTVRDGPRVRAQIGYVPERPDGGYRWMRVGQLLE